MKIIITGPESAGKSWLTQSLASHFDAPCLLEYSREYLAQLNRPYREEDLLRMAQGHLQREALMEADQQPLVFIDTGLLVIKIWGLYKYGRIDSWIDVQLRAQTEVHYLLCAPDLPWEDDPLRENPQDREVLFELYHQALVELGNPFAVVRGVGEARLDGAVSVVEGWI
ncbi:MAG: nicotinamide-nucleotide adenylyltransferase [Saprospiraceae bacterium]|nr:MAG: nicotinamide-nucleotide adenylyltransferase [Saprospiraceae bacterium]